jgi:ribosome-binding factor A
MISVLPKEKEKAAYGFIKRNLGELRKNVSKNLKINPIPYLDVFIDEGEKNRQKIDELLNNV